MSINSTLKKEGINVISQLNTMQVNSIASNISEKLSKAFPEHNIDKSDLFISIARLNMYIAEMPNDMAAAKYFYKNNSIYFSKDMNLEDLSTLAVHECLHFMQEVKNKYGRLLRLGLYTLDRSNSGIGLNEAAVQYMASIATDAPIDSVKYYNMEISTISPDYYPLQTALLNEMIYFTGTYPLYHSTLYSNDIFKNTFSAIAGYKTFAKIEKNFDLILEYESILSEETYKLSICSEELKSINKIKRINSKIADLKAIILEKTLETQNMILLNCFGNALNSIRNLEDIQKFEQDLYNFRHVIITTDNYNFYNDFYTDMLSKLEDKKEFILKYGNILKMESLTQELANINEVTYGVQFFRSFFKKLTLLFEEKIREKDF